MKRKGRVVILALCAHIRAVIWLLINACRGEISPAAMWRRALAPRRMIADPQGQRGCLVINEKTNLDVFTGSGPRVCSAAVNCRYLLDLDASHIWLTVNAPYCKSNPPGAELQW